MERAAEAFLAGKNGFKASMVMLAALLVNLATAIYATQLFSTSYPLGMDTFSHLPKLLYMVDNGLASWFFDWYAGMPLFLFYPPLSYFFAYLPTLLGLNPLLSYKLVEVVFILAAPIVFYFFCRRLGLSGERAAYATLFFSLIPFIPLNSIVFGRFPNIVAMPFYLAALIFFFEAVETHSKRSVLAAGGFFALTLLTHHLSAYILTISVAILLLNVLFGRESFRAKLRKVFSLSSPLIFGLLLSSFWLIPFLVYLKYWHQLSFNPSSLYYLPVASVIFILTVLGVSMLSERLSKTKDMYSRVMLAWVFLFFIYGAYLLPGELLLPGGGEVDLMRFQLYASIPLAVALATREKYDFGLVSRKLFGGYVSTSLLVTLLLTVNVVAGAVILASTPQVVAQEVDVGRIPPEIAGYLASQQCFGRILAIDCPFWVYLLPHYTGKRLIDGWYPQGSILVMLKKVGKTYTLNNCKNDGLIRHFIERADDYGIRWILVSEEGRTYLLQNSHFKPVLEAEGIILYENQHKVSYVDVKPQAKVSWSWSRDKIELRVESSSERTEVIVKEAYFPAWKAYDNGVSIPLKQSELGFMKLTLQGRGEHRVTLLFEEDVTVQHEIKRVVDEGIEQLKEKVSSITPIRMLEKA